eukprot:TRINITY_DN2170_c0_g1_i1.p1 TRINITY_DN2170_c0_g1~~TRINITY_DN2170_c0_g1_i1.p1  ORF type:complete len:320 (-),score=27.24 TRINITY_DN2170_c0_g1_i1:15-974(-)
MATGLTYTVQRLSQTADFRTISECLKICNDGDTIRVKIGQYDEKVILDKSVHILGDLTEDGTRADVVITAGVVCRAGGSLSNVTVQGLVDVCPESTVVIEGCDINGGSDGIRVQRNAHPQIRGNVIRDAQQGGDGVYVGEGSHAVVEGNEIAGHRVNGVHCNGAQATIRNNTIHDCAYGVYLRQNSTGTIEGNRVSAVSYFGIYIKSASDPMIRDNSVSECGVHALMVSDGARGSIQGNVFNGSVSIKRGTGPVLGGSNTIAGRMENENLMAASIPAPPTLPSGALQPAPPRRRSGQRASEGKFSRLQTTKLTVPIGAE